MIVGQLKQQGIAWPVQHQAVVIAGGGLHGPLLVGALGPARSSGLGPLTTLAIKKMNSAMPINVSPPGRKIRLQQRPADHDRVQQHPNHE